MLKDNDLSVEKSQIVYILTLLLLLALVLTDSMLVGILTLFLVLIIGLEVYRNDSELYEFGLNQKLLISLLLIIGAYLRLQGIYTESFIHPESISANLASSLAENGIPQHPSGAEEWRSFPHILLLAIFGSVFGFSEVALRMVSVIASLVTILATYHIGKELFGKEAGLISAGIITLMSWQIVWGQKARMYALFQLLYLLSIFYIYKTGNEPSKKNVLLMSGTVILSMLVHVTAYILPIIAVSYLGYINYRNQENSLRVLKIILAVALSGILVSILHFDYQWILSERIVFGGPYFYDYYLSWIWNDSSIVLYVLGGIGFFSSIKRNRDLTALFLLAVIPASFVYLFLYSTAANPRYIYFTIPFFAVWSSLALIEVSSRLPSKLRRKGLIVILLITLASLSIPTNLTLFDKDPDYKSAYSYVETNYNEGDKLISSQSPPASYYFRDPDKTIILPVWEDEVVRDYGERYSGSELIDSTSSLNKTLEKEESLWLVLATLHYEDKWKTIVDEEFGEPEFESDNIKVWRREP